MRYYALLLSLTAVAAAQQPTPVFRAITKFVEVNVIALDDNGKAVTDLQKEDFEVFESGKPQKIALFRFEGVFETPPAVQTAPPPTAPGVLANNVGPAALPVRNVTALVLDSLNTAFVDNVAVRAQMTRYLKNLAPLTRVAVYMLGTDLRVLHDFTSDPEELRRCMEKAATMVPPHADSKIDDEIQEAEELVRIFSGDPVLRKKLRDQIEWDMMADVALRGNRTVTTLRAMEAVGRHLTGIRGRKNLIWISGGINMLLTTGSHGFGPRGTTKSFETDVRAVSQRLAQRGVALHIVDARGLDSTPLLTKDFRSIASQTQLYSDLAETNDANLDTDAALQLMASLTGGRYLKNTNDMAAGMKSALADMRGSYTLGFYTDCEPDDKWHSLQVRVHRNGLKLRHRQGWIAESTPTRAPDWKAEDWIAMASAPLASTDIRLKAECRRERNTLQVNLIIDPDDVAFQPQADKLAASLHVVLAQVKGRHVRMPSLQNVDVRLDPQRMAMLRATGIRYTSTWTPESGDVALRLIVRDRHSGKCGSLDLPAARAATPPGA